MRVPWCCAAKKEHTAKPTISVAQQFAAEKQLIG
jgi:hypothetical protein